MAPLVARTFARLSRHTTSSLLPKHLPAASRLPRQLLASSFHSSAPLTKPQPQQPIANMSATAFLDTVKARRTYYALNKTLPVSKERVQEIVKEALQHVPSSFNSQSNRILVVFDEHHDKVWDITTETLKAIVPEASWEPTAQRMAGFRGAAATVLFFEDQAIVKGFQEKIAIYADNFPIWATQSNAMLQFTVWTALEAEGLGANLQHYNPLIDAKVAETFGLPETWKLAAQLVIGGKAGEAGPKEFAPVEEKIKVFGA